MASFQHKQPILPSHGSASQQVLSFLSFQHELGMHTSMPPPIHTRHIDDNPLFPSKHSSSYSAHPHREQVSQAMTILTLRLQPSSFVSFSHTHRKQSVSLLQSDKITPLFSGSPSRQKPKRRKRDSTDCFARVSA
jgi:hypothetical protein